jgi:hypothetical protein
MLSYCRMAYLTAWPSPDCEYYIALSLLLRRWIANMILVSPLLSYAINVCLYKVRLYGAVNSMTDVSLTRFPGSMKSGSGKRMRSSRT